MKEYKYEEVLVNGSVTNAEQIIDKAFRYKENSEMSKLNKLKLSLACTGCEVPLTMAVGVERRYIKTKNNCRHDKNCPNRVLKNKQTHSLRTINQPYSREKILNVISDLLQPSVGNIKQSILNGKNPQRTVNQNVANFGDSNNRITQGPKIKFLNTTYLDKKVKEYKENRFEEEDNRIFYNRNVKILRIKNQNNFTTYRLFDCNSNEDICDLSCHNYYDEASIQLINKHLNEECQLYFFGYIDIKKKYGNSGYFINTHIDQETRCIKIV